MSIGLLRNGEICTMKRKFTTEKLCQEFIFEKQLKGLKVSSIAGYMAKIERYVIPNMPKYIRKTKDKDVYALVEKCSKTLSRKTAIDVISLLNGILKFAYGKKYIKTHIEIPKPSKRKREITIFNDEEQIILKNYLLNNIDNFHYGVLLVLFTGMRIGELSALKFGDVQKNVLNINKTLQRIKNIDSTSSKKTTINIDLPKSDSSIRRIPIKDNILVKLLKSLKGIDSDYLLTGNENFIEPRTIERKFKRILDKCHIERKKFHSLRHTFATNCVKAGFEMKALSEIMGHASTSITFEYYVHVDFAFKEKNMKKLPALKTS